MSDSCSSWTPSPATTLPGWVGATEGCFGTGGALGVAVEKLLGLSVDPYEADIVATSGGDLLSFEGKVVAVISPRRGKVDFFE